MDRKYDCCGRIIEVLHGEAISNHNADTLIYVAMCKCNNSMVYITRAMTPDKAEEDHVNDVLSHLYSIPQRYAIDCMTGNAPVFIAMFRRDEEASYYHIFKGYDVAHLQDADVGTIMKWIMDHNDYAEMRCMYTEIVANHQVRIDFERHIAERQ